MAPSKLKISSCLARTPSLSLCRSGWPRWTRLAMCSQLCRSSNYPRTCLCQTDFALRHADCQAGGEGREGKSSSSSAAPTSFARRQWLLGAASSCLSYCEVSSFVARFRFCLLCNCIGRPLAAAFKTGSQPAESRQ